MKNVKKKLPIKENGKLLTNKEMIEVLKSICKYFKKEVTEKELNLKEILDKNIDF